MMSEESRCWFCHRSDAEVAAFAEVVTPKEGEIAQRMAHVSRLRGEFVQSADAWRKGIPKELKEFDFTFVTSNADQFKPIRIGNGLLGEIVAPNKLLGEILEEKKMTFDWLGSMALALREGEGEVTGFGDISSFEKADQDLLNRMIEQFEAKWRRRVVSKRADHGGYEEGLEGLKLFDGLEFMIAVGTLYYDLQARLLEMPKKKESSSKTKRGVSVLSVSGYPPVPLCSVCVDTMKELSSRRFVVGQSVPQRVVAEPPKVVNAA